MLSKLNSPLPAASPRGGGWRDQLAAKRRKRGDVDPHVKPCYSANSFLREWAEGNLSAPSVKRHCREMVKDGCDWPAIVRLSQIGGSGIDDRHAHEKLTELLCRQCDLDAFLSPAPGKAAVSEVLKPTSMFNIIKELGGEDAFKLRLGANPVEVEAFWSSSFASTYGEELQQLHPDFNGKTPHELRFSIPLIMHENAGPYGAALSCNLVSWS